MSDEVFQIGRLFFMVRSASRRNLWHFVDLEQSEGSGEWPGNKVHPYFCDCEAFHYGRGEVCRHIRVVLQDLATTLDLVDSVKPRKTLPIVKRQYTMKPDKKYQKKAA